MASSHFDSTTASDSRFSATSGSPSSKHGPASMASSHGGDEYHGEQSITGSRPAHKSRANDSDADEVRFEAGDPANPRNWPRRRKFLLLGVLLLLDLSISWGASGFSPAQTKFAEDLNVSSEVATLGLSIYVLGLAVGPLSLAPLSEYFGRSIIYVVPYACFLLFVLGTALVQDLGGFLVLRLLSGWIAGTTIANLGGTISDLYEHDATGGAMSLFLWAATAGSPTGYSLYAWIAAFRPWRDVFSAMLGIHGGIWLLTTAVVLPNETRHSILLGRRAKRLRKQGSNVDFPADMKRRGLGQLFKVALTRPFRFLLREQIVQAAAIINGYLYGLSFLFNGAFNLVFGKMGHGFPVWAVGLSFTGIWVGISVGVLTNLWQERYFQRELRRSPNTINPEARVKAAQVAVFVLPASLFWFAWTSVHVHWIVPIIASGFFGWSFYVLILMTYMVVEDSYGMFSASALAGVGFIRNLAGMGFPLFGEQLYQNEGYQWASSLLGFLALLLIPIPFLLERYGQRLRANSPWASEHMRQMAEEQERRPFAGQTSEGA